MRAAYDPASIERFPKHPSVSNGPSRRARLTMTSRSSHTWLIGYVRGSASGYRRGTVSLRRVTSSVLLALTNGVAEDDLAPVLTSHALQWEPKSAVVVDGDSGVRS
jgi:hypothetical protein